MSEIEFTCPKCSCHDYEEIQVDITVATGCHLIEDEHVVELRYDNATNSGGHVDRYQCRGCGYTIIELGTRNHEPEICEDELDVGALAKALKALAKNQAKALFSHSDLVNRISEKLCSVDGEDLARIWNEMSLDEVTYDGDSLYRMKE